MHQLDEEFNFFVSRWGGCVIALTTKDKLSNFIFKLKDKLRNELNLPDDYEMDSLVFPTQPGMGASVYPN